MSEVSSARMKGLLSTCNNSMNQLLSLLWHDTCTINGELKSNLP